MATSNQTKNLVSAINQFACTFYAYLCQQADADNFVFAPHSIATAFAMVYAGARGNTAEEMASVFGFAEVSPDFFAAWQTLTHTVLQEETVTTANALFAHRGYPLLDSYSATVTETFSTTPHTVDFGDVPAALKIINTWVDEQTDHRIPSILDKVDPLTRLVLVNAMAFKGLWHYPFDASRTREQPFYNQDKTESTASMMAVTQKFPFGAGEGWHAVALPYENERLSLVAVLPDDITTFESNLSARQLTAMRSSLRRSDDIALRLPRWTTDTAVNLLTPLDALGIHDLFAMDAANLSGMDGTDNLYVSAAQHKAMIEVNEEGTEASAATAVVVATRSMPMVTSLTFDRPFFYYLVNNETGVILFMGRVVTGKTESGA